MIVHGSIRHDYSGKKRKKLPRPTKRVQKFEEFTGLPQPTAYRPNDYPSVTSTPASTTPKTDQSYRQEISSQYTVSIPYNKGAYQVISKENLEEIGK